MTTRYKIFARIEGYYDVEGNWETAKKKIAEKIRNRLGKNKDVHILAGYPEYK